MYYEDVKCDTKFRLRYDYLRAKFNHGLCMPNVYVFWGCMLLNAENNIEKHSYFKLLAVKAAIVEDVKTFSQYLSPVATIYCTASYYK